MKKEKKYITYNENTKIIEIKSKENNSFQLFLERNKIYFETIMMVAISIAGIIVSLVGIKVSMVANDISLEAKRVEDLEKQPSFVVKTEIEDEKYKYTIKNVGGDIRGGSILSKKVIIIKIYDENYGYLGTGYIFLDRYIESNFSVYNFEDNSFVVYENIKRGVIPYLTDTINNIVTNHGYFFGTEATEYFELSYIDYKQDKIEKIMIKQGLMLNELQYDEGEQFIMYIDLNDTDDMEIKTRFEQQLDLLGKKNKF